MSEIPQYPACVPKDAWRVYNFAQGPAIASATKAAPGVGKRLLITDVYVTFSTSSERGRLLLYENGVSMSMTQYVNSFTHSNYQGNPIPLAENASFRADVADIGNGVWGTVLAVGYTVDV